MQLRRTREISWRRCLPSITPTRIKKSTLRRSLESDRATGSRKRLWLHFPHSSKSIAPPIMGLCNHDRKEQPSGRCAWFSRYVRYVRYDPKMAERTFEKGTVYLETALEKRSYLRRFMTVSSNISYLRSKVSWLIGYYQRVFEEGWFLCWTHEKTLLLRTG